MPDREKILIGITLGSLLIAATAFGFALRNKTSSADPVTTPTQDPLVSAPTTSKTIEISLVNGWNMFSMPYNFPTNTTVQQILGNTSPIYTLADGEWRQVASRELMTPSTGYLVKTQASSSISVDITSSTETRSPYTENVSKGYSLITNPFAKDSVSLPVVAIKNKKYSAKDAIANRYIRLYKWNAGLQKFESLIGNELLKEREILLVQTNDQTTFTFIK